MSNRNYSIWVLGFLFSLSWDSINLGLLEFARPDPRVFSGLLWFLILIISWIVGWHPTTKNFVLRNVTTKGQAILFILFTMGFLFLGVTYSMYFVTLESAAPIAQDDFSLWRAWIAYIGFIIVISATLIDLLVILLQNDARKKSNTI